MSDFTIREAFEDDVPFIVSLFEYAHVAAVLNTPSADMVRASLDDPSAENYIVEADGEPAGNFVIANHEWLFDFRLLAIAMPGRGAGTFALRWGLQHAFGTSGAHRVFCEVREDNLRTIAILERLGFTREGAYRDGFRNAHTGEYHDLYPYGILQRDYCAIAP